MIRIQKAFLLPSLLLVLAAGSPISGVRADDSKDEGLYQRGSKSLDERRWDQAIEAFNEVVRQGGSRRDGALYWKAYAQNKLGQRSEALETLQELSKSFPNSRWSSDAKALEVEVRQAGGQQVPPEGAADEELKLIALNSLVNTDSERAVPMLEKLLQGNQSPKLKEKALFVLSQSGSPRAREVLAKIARGCGRSPGGCARAPRARLPFPPRQRARRSAGRGGLPPPAPLPRPAAAKCPRCRFPKHLQLPSRPSGSCPGDRQQTPRGCVRAPAPAEASRRQSRVAARTGLKHRRNEAGPCPTGNMELRFPIPPPPLAQARLQALPDLVSVALRTRGDLQRIRDGQDTAQVFEPGAAVCAGGEMEFDRSWIGSLAIVMKDELIFVQVFHRRELIKGSSATRIFLTARNILCFAALACSPRTCPTSSMDIPSK